MHNPNDYLALWHGGSLAEDFWTTLADYGLEPLTRRKFVEVLDTRQITWAVLQRTDFADGFRAGAWRTEPCNSGVKITATFNKFRHGKIHDCHVGRQGRMGISGSSLASVQPIDHLDRHGWHLSYRDFRTDTTAEFPFIISAYENRHQTLVGSREPSTTEGGELAIPLATPLFCHHKIRKELLPQIERFMSTRLET